MTCESWDGSAACGSGDNVHVYLGGLRCRSHTPAAAAGRPDHLPDPKLGLDALREERGQRFVFRETDTSLNDDRAIASGRRRSSPTQYKAARAAEETRKHPAA